jgi:hypothetical protein
MGVHWIAEVAAERGSGTGAGAAKARGRRVKAERLSSLEESILDKKDQLMLKFEVVLMLLMLSMVVQDSSEGERALYTILRRDTPSSEIQHDLTI